MLPVLVCGAVAGVLATFLSRRLNRATDKIARPSAVLGQVRQFMVKEPHTDFWQSYRKLLRDLSRLALLKIGVMLLVLIPVLIVHQLSSIAVDRAQSGNRNPLSPIINDADFAFFAMTASTSAGYAIFQRARR